MFTPFSIEDIRQSTLSQIKRVETHPLDFLFSLKKPPYLDIESIYACFEKEWKIAKSLLENKDHKQDLVDIIFPTKPCGLKLIQKNRERFPLTTPVITYRFSLDFTEKIK